MTEPRFVHLRMHTEYSVTDGIVRIDPAIERVLSQGGVALGITDLMNVFGGLRFYSHALAAGLKPILGCDIRIRNDKFPDRPYRMAFYCMNHTGYHSLCVLLTKAFLECDEPYRGQIRDEWLEEPGATEGLIALTGGRDGRLARMVETGSERQAKAVVERWKRIFPNRLYIEIQRVGRRGEDACVQFLVDTAVENHLPLVATNPIQFIDQEDFEAHDVRCCIAGGFTLNDPRRDTSYTNQQYMKTEEEMCELFKDLPSALENSVLIAKRCNIDGVLSKPQLPLFPTPDGMSLDDYMDKLSREGLDRRLRFLYPDDKVREEKYPAYLERLDYELGIIKKMQFPGYFLIVQDFINWSKTHGVPVGPGRGSGAGSLVAYSLGITDLDPLHFDLLFERFLNPERVSMPDFDVDFCQYNRDRTIEYVKATYGVDAVSQIATFGTLGAKAVIRDVARVLDVPFSKADRLAKLIPVQPGKNVSLKEAMTDIPEFKEAVEKDDEYKELLRLAMPLEGITRNLGMHAGGVLIAPGRLTDFCPLYNSDGAPENTVSMFDKKDVENVGLVKFDFLGLTTLSILAKCKEYIDRLYPEQNFEMDRIPVDDEETYGCFQYGNTEAVFQFESDGMRQLLRQARPDRLEDLVALNALYRPGPMDLIPSFIARKFGKEKVEYLDKRMEPVLAETYGIMVYQEQVMRVAQVVGGYSLGGADLLRRAMGKKNVEEMKRQRVVFQKGAAERGVKESVATEIFNLMEKFAGYGFNKSHAAAYSYVAYQTAYLKTHFTSCFMAANLCMVMDQGEKMKALLDDAHLNGVDILPPDVNNSDWFFTAPDEAHIRFGLGGIKGIGRQQVDAMIETREKDGPFKDIFDLTARVKGITTRILEGLIRVGAFDSIDPDRGKLYGNVAQAIAAGHTVAASAGQNSLFFDDAEPERIVSWVEAESWSDRRKLIEEKSALGFWLSGHLYDLYRDEVQNYTTSTLVELQPGREMQRLAGVVTGVRVIQGKRGRMGAVTIDDGTAVIDVMCFTEAWEKFRYKFVVDSVVCIEGRIRYDEFSKRMSVSVNTAMSLDDYRAGAASYLRIDVDATKKRNFDKIEKALLKSKKETGVSLAMTIKTKKAEGMVYLPFCVGDVDQVRNDLKNTGEVESTKIVYND